MKKKLAPLLEFESGLNDPTAVFFVLMFLDLLTNPAANAWRFVPVFIMQMGLGAVIGYLLGRATAWMVNRVRLEYDGLYPVITIATVLLAYGGTDALGGSGLLAVYAAGLTMSRLNFLHKIALTQFHDGLGWLMQIALFVLFGLLVFPSKVLPLVLPGIALSLFLILVARPLAVFLSLAFVRMKKREKLFLSWAGLRGAVPIVFATYPLTRGLPSSELIFNLVFFVVLSSVLVQGTTIRLVARLLKVLLDRPAKQPLRQAQSNTFEVTIYEDSPAAGKQVVDLNLPSTALLLLLTRGERNFIPRGATVIRAADVLLVVSRRGDAEELRSLLLGHERVDAASDTATE